MLDRADSQAIQAVSPPSATRFRPGRGREIRRKPRRKPPFSPAPRSPASTPSLRDNPPWFGVWRQRLALARRRRQRGRARPRRGRSGVARRLPSHPPRRRSRPGRPAAAGLARADRGLRRRMALPDRTRRRSAGRSARRALQAAIEAAAACADGKRLAPFAAARCSPTCAAGPRGRRWRQGRANSSPLGSPTPCSR